MSLELKVRESFAPAGALSQAADQFRERGGQTRMALAVARTIEQGGAYINNVVRQGHDTVLGPQDLASETVMVVRQGKKKYALLKFV